MRLIIAFILFPLMLVFSPESFSEMVKIEKENSVCGCNKNNKIETLKTLPVIKEKEIFKTQLDNDLFLTSMAAAIVDMDRQQLVYQKNAEQKFPIASLTKLMTAVIFIESGIALDKEIVFVEEDNEKLKSYFSPGESIGKLYVSPGEKLTVRDLFYSSLVGSANNATLSLVRSTGLDEKEFVRQMNQRAQSLGLKNTFFEEPTGLSPSNVSTVLEVAGLADYAFRNNLIKKATATAKYSFQTINSKKWHTIRNTNWLINMPGLFGSKTGYLEEAGCCIAIGINCKNKNYIIVLLGAKDSKTRFEELEIMADWLLEDKE